MDLTSPTGCEALLRAVALYVWSVDPLLDIEEKLVEPYLKHCIAQSSSSQKLSDELESTSRRVLAKLGLSDEAHSDEYIEFLGKLDGRQLEGDSVPKTNFVATLRFLRRQLNKIAVQLTKEDVVMPFPTVSFRYGRKAKQLEPEAKIERKIGSPRLKKESVCYCIIQLTTSVMPSAIDKYPQGGLSLAAAFPRGWPAFLSDHFRDTGLEGLENFLVLRYKAGKADLMQTPSFSFPQTEGEIDLLWNSKFYEKVFNCVQQSELATGLPEPLKELLQQGFRYQEEDCFEKYRDDGHHLQVVFPPDPFIPEEVLQALMEGECTKPLGTIAQPRWFCDSRSQLICRTLSVPSSSENERQLTTLHHFHSFAPFYRFLCFGSICE